MIILDFEAQYRNRNFVVLGEFISGIEDRYFIFSSNGIKDPSQYLSSYASTNIITVYDPEYQQYITTINVYSEGGLPTDLILIGLFLVATLVGFLVYKNIKSNKIQKFPHNRIICLQCKTKLEEGS